MHNVGRGCFIYIACMQQLCEGGLARGATRASDSADNQVVFLLQVRKQP